MVRTWGDAQASSHTLRASLGLSDAQVTKTLRRLGWRVFVIWECQTQSDTRLLQLASKIGDYPI